MKSNSPTQLQIESSLVSRHFLPLAVLLISVSWIFQVHIYLPPNVNWIPFTFYAIAFLLLILRNIQRKSQQIAILSDQPVWITLVGLGSCGLAFLVFPYPYHVGLIPLGLGFILQLRVKQNSILDYLGKASLQLGLLLILSAALLPLVLAWSVRFQELPGLAAIFTYLVTALMKVFGQTVQSIDGGLLISTFEDCLPQTLIAAKLFPVPILLFVLLWGAIIIIRGRNVFEHLILFGMVVILFGVMRTTLLLLIFIQRMNVSYFWEFTPLVLSILPLALFVREPDPKIALSKPPKRQLGVLSSLLLGFVVGGGLVVALTFRDPGTLKSGRILINEHGSDWEWTTEPMDTVTYNEKTTYNYYCLTEFLKNYYDITPNFDPLTAEMLKDIDVLILKMPTQPYTADEINAIVSFVKQGGGLWVIGDHTNVFGSSSFLNPLVSRFGYRFNYDSTHDLATGNLSLFRKPPIFAHPTVVNLPPYLFATSSSIIAPWSAEAAILGYGLRNDHLDYSQKNFFADRSRKQFNHGFGLLMQQAASYVGKGRLLLYTDSTTFSNFFIFIKGKPELVLGSLNWLNRTNRWDWMRHLALVLSLAAIAVLFLKRGWNRAALSGMILSAALLSLATDRGAKSAYPLPEPKQPVPWINFEREHSNYFLPELRLETDKDKSYLTFYVWTQRLGLVPREVDSFKESISGTDPVVMIDLMQPLSSIELTLLRDYLLNGGRLLYLHSADNASAASVDLLREFGLNQHNLAAASDTLHTLTLGGRFFPLRSGGKFASLTGGNSILTSDQGETIVAEIEIGKGKLIAVSCGQIFRNNMIGQTTVVPDEGLKGLYRIEYRLVQEITSELSVP